jgi:hypothetical protein
LTVFLVYYLLYLKEIIAKNQNCHISIVQQNLCFKLFLNAKWQNIHGTCFRKEKIS